MSSPLRPVRRFAENQLAHPLEGFRVRRDDEGIVLRETARIGAAGFFLVSRALRRERRIPGVTPGPPGRPFSGYGSRERYIASRATEYAHGSAAEGRRVWWFVPDVLLDGHRAPVVVYLHGFRASAPDLYWEHIHHLTAQGYVVVFPRINKGGTTGLFTDNDQREMLQRAIDATVDALDHLDDVVDRDRLTVFGHSLGGLIGACWNGAGAPPANTLVLAHPSVRMDAIPAPARRLITPVEWQDLAAANPAPVLILGGDQDTLVPPDECIELGETFTAASTCVVRIARADDHGVPALRTGHLATVRTDSKALRWAGQLLGGNEANDALQSRYYHAALDAALAGDADPAFDFGNWSDGKPVAEPLVALSRTAAETETPRSRRTGRSEGGQR